MNLLFVSNVGAWGTICILACSLSIGVRAQTLVDGFMRGAGKSVFALSYSTESYDEFFKGTVKTSEPNLGSISTQSVSLFAGFGLTDDLDVVMSLPWISTSASQGYWSTQSGIQDLSAALKWRAYSMMVGESGSLSAIASVGMMAPMTDYVPDAPVAIGHNSTMATSRLLVNYQSGFGLFGNVAWGYTRCGDVVLDRGYSTNVPDFGEMALKVGLANEHYYIDAWYQNQSARGGSDIAQRTNLDSPISQERGLSFPSQGISFSRIGGTVFVPANFLVQNFGVGVGGAYTLDGRNIGKSMRLSFSAVYNLTLWSPSGSTPSSFSN